MTYEFGIAPSVLGGPGSLSGLAGWVARSGSRRPLVITDPALVRSGIAGEVQEALGGAPVVACVSSEPTAGMVAEALEVLKGHGADLVVGLGGGSAIDTAKLAGVLATNASTLAELAADWNRVRVPSLPLVTIPTTVGTGSEMTRGAVFKDTATAQKLVIVSDHLAPRLALLDPLLLRGVPSKVIAATGCDALTQGIEGVLSTAATPWTDALHLHGVRLIIKSLRRAVSDACDLEARGAMQAAAAMVGAGLARSGVGAVHAVANTLGGRFPIPHGVACAITLLPVLGPSSKQVPDRFGPLVSLPGDAALGSAGGRDLISSFLDELRALLVDIDMEPRLSEFGVGDGDLGAIAKDAHGHSDMATSPYHPGIEEIEAMLREVL